MSLSLLIAIENALVVLTIWKDPFKQLKGSPANYLILNLAVCDLLIGIPSELLSGLLYWFPCKLNVFLVASTACQLTYGASFFTILSLAVERLIVITYPLRSADYLTTSIIPLIITSIWIFAGLFAFLPLTRLDLYCTYKTYIADDACGISILILVVACYIRIYLIVRKSLYRDLATPEERQGEEQYLTESARRIEKLKRKERSVARTVFILVMIFLGSWIPVFVLRNLDNSCNHYNLWFWEGFFSKLHPLLNPLAYSLCTKKFRRAFWRMFQGLCNHGNNETPESTRFPCGTIFP